MGLLKKRYSFEEAVKKMNESGMKYTPVRIKNTGYYELVLDDIIMEKPREELKRKRMNNEQRKRFLEEQSGYGKYLGIDVNYDNINYQKEISELNNVREAYREDY